jgi:basic amino acid/polyamine antiporter, APA family
MAEELASKADPLTPRSSLSNQPHLQRVLGLWSAAAIVVGTVIGSGIFLVPGRMIAEVGSTRNLFFVWILGGLLTLFGALTYAELAAAMPEAGGEYVFLSEAYGPFWGYLYSWTQLAVAKSGSIATLGSGFYLYLSVFFPTLGKPVFVLHYPIGPGGGPLEVHYGQLIAIAVIIVLCAINYVGVEAGGHFQVFITAVKMILIAGVIVIGLFSGHGDFHHFHESAGVSHGFAGFFAALVGALWAYDGWNNVSMVSSEIRNPERNLPRALILGTLAVIATYILINIAYFYVLGPAEVAQTSQVAAGMMARLFGSVGAKAVTIAVMISILAALNGSILSGARVPYAMARDGYFFRALGVVHPKFKTPSFSMVVLCLWSCALILSGWYEQLYEFVIFGSWILYAMTAASVFVLRRKKPNMPRPYHVLGYPVVPAFFVLVACVLLVSTLLHSPRESFMGLGFMALGIPLYFHFRRARRKHFENGPIA